MATVSIHIAGMRTLVQSVEKAVEGIPQHQSAVRGDLSRVGLGTSSVSTADNVVSWLQGEIAGLRRRLAMALAIESSTPGVQSFVQFDEAKLPTTTPAQAEELADQVAEAIKDPDGEIDPEILQILTENSVDPYFASALAKHLSPEQIASFAQSMGSRRDYVAQYELMHDPEALTKYDATYAATLDGLAQTLGLATMQTGADLKLPADYNAKWLAAMTDEEVTRPGQASWLALVMSRGTWSTDFTVDITRGIYEHEKSVDMRGMWQMDAYPVGGSTYTGAIAPGGEHAYDPLALALQAVGRNQDAALELFAHGPTTKIPVEGREVEVNEFVKYLIAERRWPVDCGQGAKEALAAGMTPQLGGSTDTMLVAQFANAVIAYKTAEIEARADDGGNWFSDIGHLVLDGLGLIPGFGEIADGVNAIWYYAEGNVIDGTLSAGAMIPFLGWGATGGKWARRAELLEGAVKLVGRDGQPLDEAMLSVQLLAKADNLEPGLFKFDELADFNRAANNAHPGVVYQYKDMSWSVDEFGRVQTASGKLKLESGGREPQLQREIGNGPDARDSDVGFHLIGDALGGPTNRLNVLPGNGKPIDDGLANLNQGQYASMERALRGALKEGKEVRIELTPVYPDTGTIRPSTFEVTTWVDGAEETYTFVNK